MRYSRNSSMRYSSNLAANLLSINTVILAICIALFSISSQAKNKLPVNTVISADEQRVIKLLDKAVKHIQDKGPGAVSDFDSNAAFIDNELYVFALRVDGLFLASGGSSMVLKGELVWNTPDAVGQAFFHRIIEKALSDGKGTVKYFWTNPVSRNNKPKHTLFKRVGDVIVAVGYHPAANVSIQQVGSLDEIIIVMVTDED